MLKQLLTGSYVFVLLLAGIRSVQAQVPNPAPSTQPQVTTAPQTQISPEELQKFARTLKQLIVIEQGVNQQISQAVSQSGLSEQRFTEIYQARNNPPSQPKTAISSQEKQKFDRTFTKLGEIQQQGQSKMQQIVKKEGIEPARFQQIMAAVKQDPALKQKVQQMIQS